MPEPRHWHLMLYDVFDDKRLRRVRKHLESWGTPVQYSVFRVRGTERELERLRFELSKILDDEDRLMIVRLCPGCAGRVTMRGDMPEVFDEDVPPFRIA